MVKVIYCQSQSGGMWFCFDTHWYVALKPQDLHVFELLLWQENVSESSLAYAALASNAQAFGTAGEQRCVPTSASGHSTFSPYGLANYYSEPAIHQDPIVIYQDHHITFCGTLPNKIRSVSFYGTARRCRCSAGTSPSLSCVRCHLSPDIADNYAASLYCNTYGSTQPGKQRDGGKLCENDEARLHQHHAEARRVNSGKEPCGGLRTLTRIVHWGIVRHGNICGGEPVMG